MWTTVLKVLIVVTLVFTCSFEACLVVYAFLMNIILFCFVWRSVVLPGLTSFRVAECLVDF